MYNIIVTYYTSILTILGCVVPNIYWDITGDDSHLNIDRQSVQHLLILKQETLFA